MSNQTNKEFALACKN